MNKTGTVQRPPVRRAAYSSVLSLVTPLSILAARSVCHSVGPAHHTMTAADAFWPEAAVTDKEPRAKVQTCRSLSAQEVPDLTVSQHDSAWQPVDARPTKSRAPRSTPENKESPPAQLLSRSSVSESRAMLASWKHSAVAKLHMLPDCGHIHMRQRRALF